MISVVIPMYNASDSILACIESVINQTYNGEIEIIVVNDGSTDGSALVVENYCKTRNINNLTVIDKLNGGVSSARNMGIRLAKGRYIALLDSDDIWLPNKLSIQMEHFEKYPSLDFIGCNRNNERVGFPYKSKDGKIEITLRRLLIKVVAQTSTAIFKRSIINDVGYFDENQRYSEDANFWIRISIKKKMVLIQESLVITGDGKPNYGAFGLSSNLYEMEKGNLKNIQEVYKMGYISIFEYHLFKSYSRLKYWRRCLIVFMRKFN